MQTKEIEVFQAHFALYPSVMHDGILNEAKIQEPPPTTQASLAQNFNNHGKKFEIIVKAYSWAFT